MPEKHFVIDTNVFLSAMLFPSAKPSMALRKAIAAGRVVLSTSIIEELSEKFSEKKFDTYLPLADRLSFLEQILALSHILDATTKVKACRDPDDDMFLELAVAIQADCIISGDKALLELNPFRGIPILTPSDFMVRF